MNYLSYLEGKFASYTNTYIITDEINYQYNGTGNAIIIKYLAGTNYQDSTVQPVQLAVYTKDPIAIQKDLENFAKNAYDTNNSAVTLFHNNDVPGDIGIGKYSKQEIHVRTCWDSTCPAQTNANTKNVDQCIINVE